MSIIIKKQLQKNWVGRGGFEYGFGMRWYGGLLGILET
jgi:hypothetical protein